MEQPERINRKAFLKRSGVLGLGSLGLGSLAGCGLLFEREKMLCTVAELEAGDPIVREFNWEEVLVTRRAGEVVIFSLVCTHKKCTVAWQPRERQFACPCHEGLYDEEGEVIDGPPPAPLLRFVAEVRGEEIWVKAEEAKRPERQQGG